MKLSINPKLEVKDTRAAILIALVNNLENDLTLARKHNATKRIKCLEAKLDALCLYGELTHIFVEECFPYD